jgi:hypothetical protein
MVSVGTLCEVFALAVVLTLALASSRRFPDEEGENNGYQR